VEDVEKSNFTPWHGSPFSVSILGSSYSHSAIHVLYSEGHNKIAFFNRSGNLVSGGPIAIMRMTNFVRIKQRTKGTANSLQGDSIAGRASMKVSITESPEV